MQYIVFTGITGLRRFTFRVPFTDMTVLDHDALLRALSTITSPVFSEFVLELGGLPTHFHGPSSKYRGRWKEIGELLENQFALHGDFRLNIRTGKLYDRETFQGHAKEIFPLLASKGCIQFEMSYSIDGRVLFSVL